MRILITGVGGPTPSSIAVSLKRFSKIINPWLLGVDSNPLATGLYRSGLFDAVAVVPSATDPNYWVAINEIVKEHEIDFALVQPEIEVVQWSMRQIDHQLPCTAFLPSSKLVQLLVDKMAMSNALQQTDLVPASVGLNRSLSDIRIVEEHLPYPFWVRAPSGSSGLGSLLVKSRESLQSWVQVNENVPEFLCSEYLPGRNLACKVLYYNGQPVRAACAERVNYIMAKIAPSGITGNTSFGRFLNEKQPIDMALRAMEILFRKTGSKQHGFFTVDMKENSDGKPQITEINVRNVAFNGCFAQLGANFSEDIVRLLEGDVRFDQTFKQYLFDDDYVFLRDVDVEPIVIRRSELLTIGR